MRGFTQGTWINANGRLQGSKVEETTVLGAIRGGSSTSRAILELYDKMCIEVAGLTQFLSQLLKTPPSKKS
jgi:hypothetical protein